MPKTASPRRFAQSVKIAFGTDTGVSPHGRNAEEFALMVENGMAPAAAIRSATVDAAELLGQSGTGSAPSSPARTPTSSPCDGDPTANVRLLEQVDFVMKHGRVHKLGGERAADARTSPALRRSIVAPTALNFSSSRS